MISISGAQALNMLGGLLSICIAAGIPRLASHTPLKKIMTYIRLDIVYSVVIAVAVIYIGMFIAGIIGEIAGIL